MSGDRYRIALEVFTADAKVVTAVEKALKRAAGTIDGSTAFVLTRTVDRVGYPVVLMERVMGE